MEITKEELEKLYRAHTNVELCSRFGISNVTLLRYIDKAGIQRKGKGNPSGKTAPKITLVD